MIVVDNGSGDGSVPYLREAHPDVLVLELGVNTGFAHAANRGLERASNELVALVNTDVVLAPDWTARTAAALLAAPDAAAVACKMVSVEDPGFIYDAGDILRRDGACEQRGRFLPDDGRWDEPGEVFGACAGAALYRRSVVRAVGGFDERYFAYLEDVDLALRLRLAGWRCAYEPALARHAGEGSSQWLRGGHEFLVTRNTLVLVARWFPVRWVPYVVYRQLGWAWHALRERRLRRHLAALAAAMPMLPAAVAGRRARRGRTVVPIHAAIPARPFRGPRAGGHPAGAYASASVDDDVEPGGLVGNAVACAWCAAPAALAGGRLAHCTACGAATTYPPPDDAELESAYAGWYRPQAGRFPAGGDRLLSFSRGRLAARLDAIAPAGPVLDVGAGDGSLLRALRARGREAVGLERVGGGNGVDAGEITEFDDRVGEWAAVVFWHSLEHLRDPAGALDRAAELLAP